MIKQTFVILFILFFSYNIFADDIQKIPRRVYFLQESEISYTDNDLKGMMIGISNFLYNSISSIIPIVRIYDEEKANSIIKVELFDEQDFIRINVTLIKDENIILIKEYLYPRYKEDYEGFSIFINTTSEEFSEHLGFVLPKVETTDILKQEQYKEAAEETEYLDEITKTWEITLWTSGLMQVQQSSDDEDGLIDIRNFSMFPLMIDAAWYFRRNLGLLYSFYFDFNDFFAFDDVRDINGEYLRKARSDNLFLLNGLGLSYRTISKVSAQFNLILYAGAVRVEAYDDINDIIAAGETGWIFFMPLNLSSILNINITPRFSIKTRMSLFINLFKLFGRQETGTYNGEFSALYFQFFSLGASVKF